MTGKFQKKRTLKAIAAVCAITFMAQDLAMAAPGLVAVAPAVPPMPHVSFKLPESVGVIEDYWKAPAANSKLIVLIQDAHTNPSGQISLARALEQILPAESIQTVYTEGAEGDVSLRFLRERVAPKTIESVALEYLKKGIVKGDDYWNAVSDQRFRLWGVEDPELYRQSLEAYQKVVKLRPVVRPYLDQTLRSALSLQSSVYTPEIARLEALRRSNKTGELSEAEYADRLWELAKIKGLDLRAFPQTESLGKLKKLETRLDSKSLAAEQEAALKNLSQTDRDELAPALAEVQKDPLEAAHARAFGLLLEEKLGRRASSYPTLKTYFGYLHKVRSFNPIKLLKEIEALQETLIRSASPDADAVTLRETVIGLESLMDLVDLKVSPEIFERLLSRGAFSDLRPLTGWINARLAKEGRHPELAVFLDHKAFEAIRSAKNFYTLTRARDQKILEKTLTRMNSAGESKAVLVTGGFHAPSLKDRLKEAGISYVSILPQVLHETDSARYEKLLLAQLDPGRMPASVTRVASASPSSSVTTSDPKTLSSARLGAPLLGSEGPRLAAALGDPTLVGRARDLNRAAAAVGARMATDLELIGRTVGGVVITEEALKHIRTFMGIDDLVADQRLGDDPEGAMSRAERAAARILRETREKGLDLGTMDQAQFNELFGIMPMMLSAGLTTRFSAYIPKHLAQGGMSRTVISHALDGTYTSPGVSPVIFIGLKHLGLVVKDEYLRGYDAERHYFTVDPAITAFEGQNRAVKIDPKYFDPEKLARYFGRSDAVVMAFIKPMGHGDAIQQAVSAVAPDTKYPYLQVAFGEVAASVLPTNSNASFISYLEIVATDAEAVAGARKLKAEEKVTVKGNYFFNGDPSQMMAYTDFEQIPHEKPTGKFDYTAIQKGPDLAAAREELNALPDDPRARMERIQAVRARFPYFAISDDGVLFDQETLVAVVADVRRWEVLLPERREWIRRHFAVHVNEDRGDAEFLISANTATYRIASLRALAGEVEELRKSGGFDQEGSTDVRINLFWSTEPKDGGAKTLAWNYVRLMADHALENGRPINAALAYVGEHAPSSIKDPAKLKEFVHAAVATNRTGVVKPPRLSDEEKVIFEELRGDMVRGQKELAKLGLYSLVSDPTRYDRFRSVVRALFAASSSELWQSTLLDVMDGMTKNLSRGVTEPGSGPSAHAPPHDQIIYGIIENLTAEAVDAGWIGNNAFALVSNPEYAAAITRLRNRYAAELQRLQKKDLLIMAKTSRAEYLLDRLADTIGAGIKDLNEDLGAALQHRSRFDSAQLPHVPILAVVGSVDDGGSSEANKIAVNRMGYGIIPAPGDQVHSMEGLITRDKADHLMGEGGRIESGASFMGGIAPFILKTISDPSIVLNSDFFVFCNVLLASVRNVDRMNEQSWATAGFESQNPAHIDVRNASIRNLYLIGLLREAGLLTTSSATNVGQAAVRTASDMARYRRAMIMMAEGAGVKGFESAVSSFNPATLYARYSGYTLMLAPEGSFDPGRRLPIVIEPGTNGRIRVKNPSLSEKTIDLEPGQEVELRQLGISFNEVHIGNAAGQFYLKVKGVIWRADDSDINQIALTDPTGEVRYLASDGTGRERSLEGSREQTPLFTTVSGGVFLSSPLIKRQTFITEFSNHARLLEIGLLDGYGMSGKVPAEPLLQPANEPLIDRVRAAGIGDMIVIGPGSHFTSIDPHFLVKGFPQALQSAKANGAEIIYMMNGVYDNETTEHTPEELLAAIEKTAGVPFDSMITRVAGCAPETDEELAARSKIDVAVLRTVIHTPGESAIRVDETTASDAAKKGRALIYLNPSDEEAILRRWPALASVTPIKESLIVKRVQKRKADSYDYRVVHRPGAVYRNAILPATQGLRPYLLIAVTGGSAVGALWSRISEKLMELPERNTSSASGARMSAAQSHDVRGPLMEKIDAALGKGRFRVYPGGFASIDITPLGVDKRTAMTDLMQGKTHAVYFGDEFFKTDKKTGNDTPILTAKAEMADKNITVFSVDIDPDQRTDEAKAELNTIWIGKGPEATRRVLGDVLAAIRSGKNALTVRGQGPDAHKSVTLDLEALRGSGAMVFDVDGTVLESKKENFANQPEARGLFESLLGAEMTMTIISGNSRSEQKKRVSDELKSAAGIKNLKMYVNGGATRMDFDAAGAESVVNLSGDLLPEDIGRVAEIVAEAAKDSFGLSSEELAAWKEWFAFDGTHATRPDFAGIKFKPFWTAAGFTPDLVSSDEMAQERNDSDRSMTVPFVEERDNVQLSIKLFPKAVDLKPAAARMAAVLEPERAADRESDRAVFEPAVRSTRTTAAAASIEPPAKQTSEAEASEPQDFALNRLEDWFAANYGEPPVIETLFEDSHKKRFWATSLEYEGHQLLIRLDDMYWHDTDDSGPAVYHIFVDRDTEGYQTRVEMRLDANGRVDARKTIDGLFIPDRRKQKNPWAEPLLKRWIWSMDGLSLGKENPLFNRHPMAAVTFDQEHPGFPIYRPTTYGRSGDGVRQIGSPIADPNALEAPMVTAGRKTLVFYGGLGAVVPRFYMEYLKKLALEYDVVFEAVDLLPDDAARQRIETMGLPYTAYHQASEYKIDPKNPPAGIVVLTRPDSHFDLTQWANSNGVPVFVEKPITLPETIGKMRDHFRDHPEEMFAIDFFFDNPSAKEALKLIDEGKIGRIESIEGEMIEENGIEKGREWLVTPHISGGGLGMDMLVHLTALSEMILERWGMSLRHAELEPKKILLARYEGAPAGTESYARLEGAVEKDVKIKFGAGKGLNRSAYYLIVKGDKGEIEINLGTEHEKGFMEFRPFDGGEKIRIENTTSDIGYNGTTKKMVHSLHVPGEISRREREFRMEATSLSVWLMNNAQVMHGPRYQTIPLHQDPSSIESQDVGQASLSDREYDAIQDIGKLSNTVERYFREQQPRVRSQFAGPAQDDVQGQTVEATDYLMLLLNGKLLVDLDAVQRTHRVSGVIMSPMMSADVSELEGHIREAVTRAGWEWTGFARPTYLETARSAAWIDVEWPQPLFDFISQKQGPDSVFPKVTLENGKQRSEQVPGMRLSDWIFKNRALPPREFGRRLAEWSLRIADAVAELEKNGLSHGDLQPVNVVVRPAEPGTVEAPVLIDWADPHHPDAVAIRSLLGEGLWNAAKEFYFFNNQYSITDGTAAGVVEIFGADLVELAVNRYETVAQYADALRAYLQKTEGARLSSDAPQALADFAGPALKAKGVDSARMAYWQIGAGSGVYDLTMNRNELRITRGTGFVLRRDALQAARAVGLDSASAPDPTAIIRRKQEADAQADRLAAGSGAYAAANTAALSMAVRVPVDRIFGADLTPAEARAAAQYLVDELLNISTSPSAPYVRGAVFYFDPAIFGPADQRATIAGGMDRRAMKEAVSILRDAALKHSDRFVIGQPEGDKLIVNWLAEPMADRQLKTGQIYVQIGQITHGVLPSFRMGLAVPFAAVRNTVGTERWKEFFDLRNPERLADLLSVFDGFQNSAQLLPALQGLAPYRPEQFLRPLTMNAGVHLIEVLRLTLSATSRSA